MTVHPYNPLDKNNLGDSIVQRLLSTEAKPLPTPGRRTRADEPPFEGAGIYAIYYLGSFDLYREQSEVNLKDGLVKPIYIGKADPKGGRRGGLEMDAAIGTALFDRIREHAASVASAENLSIDDFRCKWLVVDEVWISLAERLAIRQYLPTWNTLIDGFGNHDPGGRRKDQYRSDWDVLHPGRRWVEKLGSGPNTIEQIRRRLLAKHTPAELEELATRSLSEGNDAGA